MKYISLFVVFGSVVQSAVAATLVAPLGFEANPGPANNTIPFTWAVPRYQQIYGAEDLVSMIGKQIRTIAFRVDEKDGFDGDYAGGFVYANLEIRLSISPLAVNALTSNLDANVGPNAITVVSGQYVVPPLEGDLSVNPFDLRIDFDTPFFYAGGNLLMDIFKDATATPLPLMDAVVSNSDSVKRAYIGHISGIPRSDDSLGLITQFSFLIPEPSALSLCVCTMIFFASRYPERHRIAK